MLEALLLTKKAATGPTGGFALFAGGLNQTTGVLNKTQAYGYADNTMMLGTTLTSARYQMGGVGTATYAYFMGGYTSPEGSKVDRYKFGDNTVSARTALTTGKFGYGSAGNSTRGLLIAGAQSNGNASTNAIEKITYAAETHTNHSAAYVSWGLAAAGNETLAVYGGGYAYSAVSTLTYVYTHASDSSAGGPALGVGRHNTAAMGNANVAVFGGGYGPLASTDVITYSNSTRAAGTALGLARNYAAGAGKTDIGIFAGGLDSNTTYTDKYTYSGNVRVAGTALNTSVTMTAGVSSVPGGF